MPLEDTDVIQNCKRVVGKFCQSGHWFQRDPANLIDFKDNHLPIPHGHLGITCELALAIVIGTELNKHSTDDEIKAGIDGYAAVLMARTREATYEHTDGNLFRTAPEWSDCTALSTIVNTDFATEINKSSAWFSVEDQKVASIPVANIGKDPVHLVKETLAHVALGPADLVLHALEGGTYCKAGNTIEIGLENYLRSLFTVEKASEVASAVLNDKNRHPKIVQHVVDELIH